MSEIRVKSCPLLGCSYSMEQSIIRGNPPIMLASLIPCVGEKCINFAWDGDDGYCRYFQKFTNHDRRKEGESE